MELFKKKGKHRKRRQSSFQKFEREHDIKQMNFENFVIDQYVYYADKIRRRKPSYIG